MLILLSASINRCLSVTVIARISSIVDRVKALLDLSAWLPCDARGIPSPDVHWVRGEQSIDNSSKYVLFSNGTLRIDNLEESDSGAYRCIATNHAGTDAKNVSLYVHCMLASHCLSVDC